MGKRNANHPGFFKVKGAAIEDRDIAGMAKQALDRSAARRKQKGLVRKKAVAPKRARKVSGLATEPFTEPPEAMARQHDRDFARMNERRPAVRRKATPVHDEDYPSYLGATARGVIRRMVRLALTPFAVARAVAHEIRLHVPHHHHQRS
jgi:hypothetical protein